MTSKYDAYWQSKLSDIQRLLNQAYGTGQNAALDVSDIESLGDRQSWYGSVEVSSAGVRNERMAHAKALGEVVLASQALGDYGEARFRLVISNNKKLTITKLSFAGTRHSVPIVEKTSGRQSSSYISKAPTPAQKSHRPQADGPVALITKVYELIDKLPRYDHNFTSAELPSNGIYFFFERGETVSLNGRVIDRVVRIGSHPSSGRLPKRLRDHFGLRNSLGGNKNGSVMRRHVGGALLARANPDNPAISSWITQGGASDPALEENVSRMLRDNFSFTCIRVDDKTERMALEGRLIALFARYPLGSPSDNWLGRHAQAPAVRQSGLWNVNHVNGIPLSPREFEQLETLFKGAGRPGKTLIVIPCCDSKNPGGILDYPAERSVTSCLDSVTAEQLLDLRRLLFKEFGLPTGPDVGSAVGNEVAYLEAYRRYTGKLYGEISPAAWAGLRETPQLDMVIISALYGLVRYDESIRTYNASMSGHKANGKRLKTWWRSKDLRGILEKYVELNDISEVHFVLSQDYAEAVGIASKLLQANVRVPDFSRYRSGSNTHRGQWVDAFIKSFIS